MISLDDLKALARPAQTKIVLLVMDGVGGLPRAFDGKTELESLIDRTRNMAPAGFELPGDVRLPESLTFRDAPSRDVFTAVARFANIANRVLT